MPHATSVEDTDWQRVRWPDGSRYEGLVKGSLCHVRGVTVFPDGDRYEGEFVDNQMQGAGVYSWHNGTVYQGDWKNDKMHGCGVKRVKQESGSDEVEAGQFKHDTFLGPSAVCSVEAAEQSAQVAQKAASQSRGLLQVEAIEKPQQGVDLPPLLSHEEAFSMQRHSRIGLKGGHRQGAPADAQSAIGQNSAPKQTLPLRQFWLPWSLWHS